MDFEDVGVPGLEFGVESLWSRVSRFRVLGFRILWLGDLPIVSIVVPFFGLTKYIIRIL